MAEPLWLCNVRPWPGDGAARDLLLADGHIQDGATPPAGARRIDGRGGVMLPSLTDAHMHLGKTLWGLPWRGHAAGPSRAERIAHDLDTRRDLQDSLQARAGALAEQALRMGTGRLRSHVDVEPELGLKHVEALLAVRDEFAGRLDIQLVAFPQFGLVTTPGTADLMAAAVAAGVEVVGGIDPVAVDGDREAHLDTVFDLADKTGAGVDIHLHETGEAGALSLEGICDRTRSLGMGGRAAVSHAFCLGTVDEKRQDGLITALADADVAVVTYAPGASPVPPVKKLVEAGVVLALGSDGVRDTWTPFGNADMLERAMMLAYREGFRRDADIELALVAATEGAAAVLGRDGLGTAPGCPADLVVVGAATPAEAVCARPAGRLVLKAGEIVSDSGGFALN